MPVEPRPVDLEHLERIGGELAVDPAPPLDLGEVTDPAQQTVRCPLIFIGAVSISETNARTSGRPDASR